MNAVTGVAGFSGRYIARRLVSMGEGVINLTGHQDRPTEFGDSVRSTAFDFGDMAAMVASLRGVKTLYNTYWIRFAHGETTFERAVENSRGLIAAAKEAGVGRIVHVSITNPSKDSRLPYFHGKALVEEAIQESGLSFAILRPAVLFGDEGILINNIAWFLRKTPVFGIPGDGKYKMQPIFVDDLAALAVESGNRRDDVIVDAVGPEVYEFNDLVRLIGRVVNSHTLVLHMPPTAALGATWLLGQILGDVVLTADEVAGLEANLLVSAQPPTAPTKLSTWLEENSSWIGTRYFSEMRKHYG